MAEVAGNQSGSSNAFAWGLNVSTSVLIVFANKVLLSTNGGHGFTFGAARSSKNKKNSYCASQQLTVIYNLQPLRFVRCTSWQVLPASGQHRPQALQERPESR